MKCFGKGSLSRLIEIALSVTMVVILVLLFTLPWSITWRTGRVPGDYFYIRYLVVLGVSGIMAELLFWQAKGVMHNINTGRVFSSNTVHRMRVMAVETIILAAFYFVTMFWMSRFFMAALFVVFVLASGVCIVFAELFRQATAYKEENDMTI